MAKPILSKDGSARGTSYLAIAGVQNGNLVLLGDLEPDDPATKTKMESDAKGLMTPGNPIHVVQVTVIGRYMKLEGAQLAPVIVRVPEDGF